MPLSILHARVVYCHALVVIKVRVMSSDEYDDHVSRWSPELCRSKMVKCKKHVMLKCLCKLSLFEAWPTSAPLRVSFACSCLDLHTYYEITKSLVMDASLAMDESCLAC